MMKNCLFLSYCNCIKNGLHKINIYNKNIQCLYSLLKIESDISSHAELVSASTLIKCILIQILKQVQDDV